MSCRKCKSSETFIARKSEHYGLYCKTCLTWIKWIPISQVSFSKSIYEIDFYKKQKKFKIYSKKNYSPVIVK